jgi:hypothetical protein
MKSTRREIERRAESRRGEGWGMEFEPLIRVHEISSLGRVHRFVCTKFDGRQFNRKRSILHTRGQYGRVATVASIRWLDQALLSGQAVGFEMLNGSRSVTSASNARCGNSLSTRTRYA